MKQASLQRLSTHQLHNDALHSVDLEHVMDGDDVCVLKSRGGTRLAHEARGKPGLLRQPARQDLQRDLTAQCQLPSSVNQAHASTPEFGNDLEGA